MCPYVAICLKIHNFHGFIVVEHPYTDQCAIKLKSKGQQYIKLAQI